MPTAARKPRLQHDHLPEKVTLLDGTAVRPAPRAQPLSPPPPPAPSEDAVAPAPGNKRSAARTSKPPPTAPAVVVASRGPSVDKEGCAILLFHTQCLRIRDNPALVAAAEANLPVIPLFIWAPHEEGELGIGGACRVFLLEALRALQQSLLRRFRQRLVLRRVEPPEGTLAVLDHLADELAVAAIFSNRQYEPEPLRRDAVLAQHFARRGVAYHQFNASLLWQPWDVPVPRATQPRGHFGTLMSFMRPAMASGTPPTPLPTPASLPSPTRYPDSLEVEQLGLYRAPVRRGTDGSFTVVDWAAPILQAWQFGEEAAWALLEDFLKVGLPTYEKTRGRADIDTAVSRLSPYIHFGILSVREMYWKVRHTLRATPSPTFSRRLVWRDLAYWQLHVFPEMPRRCIRCHYEAVPWNTDPEKLRAWQKGQTGYPLVDAGMRELWQTGWMHQNVRMVTALFLVEYLGINWTDGLRWYHDTLVDADLAINSMMWQNAGGSGLDHWNFSIHPVDHAKFCDPDGRYVQRWVPELQLLPREFVHRPWDAPLVTLRHANVTLGLTYPHRIVVDLGPRRAKTIGWFKEMKANAGPTKCDDRGYDLVVLPDGGSVRVYTKPEYRVAFQPNSGLPFTPSKGPGKAQPHRKKGDRQRSHHLDDEGTPMTEFAACLQESVHAYASR